MNDFLVTVQHNQDATFCLCIFALIGLFIFFVGTTHVVRAWRDK